MKCYEGNILTVDSKNTVCRYLIENNGIIQYVGNELPNEFKNLETIKLGSKALIPSFVDTHQHFASLSTFNAGLNIMNASSNREMLVMIEEFVKQTKNKVLICFGASPYSVQEKKLICKTELDTVCPNKELMVVKYDGHACIINTKLLKKLDKKLSKLRGYHPDTGEMNQEAFFAVSDYITRSLSILKLIKNMQKCIDFHAKQGIGMIHSVSGVGFPFNLDITIEKIFAKSLKNNFQLRIFPQSMNPKVAKRRKLSRIGGCFECALDGCFGSHDAALIEKYIDEVSGNGVLYYSDEKVIDFCKKANRLGLQIELHAIGDKAFNQATKAIKEALDDFPRKDHRHGIIHACLPTKEGIEICKDYNIQLPIQSAFINWSQEPNDYLESILGKKRLNLLNPIKTFYENNIIVSFGSDGPCTTPNPIEWIDKAVNNDNQNECITVQDALRMCTYNGYFTTFDEKKRGSLEKGKIADMVILSDNPYSVNKHNLKNIKIEKLILSGKPYVSCNRNALITLISGIFSKRKY